MPLMRSFCSIDYRQSKQLEFERLTQDSMIVTRYKRKFKELSDFSPYMISDEATKKQRSFDGLNEDIAPCISRVAYSMY